MIVYDLQAIQSAAHGERGIARYVAELAAALERNHPDIVDVFAYNDRLPRADRLDTIGLGSKLQPFSVLRGLPVDVLHINSPFELLPIQDVQVPVVARTTVVTCYDLIPQIFPHVYLEDDSTKSRYQARLQTLFAADEIVTDSESAAADVGRILGIASDRLTSLGAGVSEEFTPPTIPLVERLECLRRSIPELRAGYVFVPTGMDWRKNIDGALEAYAGLPLELRERHQLVVACRMTEAQVAHLAWQCEGLGIDAHEVIVTGFVSDADLVLLYQSADIVFFPSYYEGFGLPVLEARRCGARVICSNTASLPEVLPESAALFNPYDRAEMTDKLAAALTDDRYKGLLDAVPDPGFTWDLAANRVVEVYDRLARRAARSTIASRTRPTVAMVTVLPPTPSGIADHSARLLAAMHEDVDVTAVVHHDVSRHDGQWPFDVVGLRTLPARWAAGEFDHVVYCLGNNALHAAFLPMLDRVPGFVFAHDVRLLGCATAAERLGIWGRDANDPAELDDAGNDQSFALTSIARSARAVLVNSEHAAELARARTDTPVVNVGPLSFPDHVTLVDDPSSSRPDDRPHLIVSAGIADVTKGSDVVAAALEILVAQRADVGGVLVGLGGDAFAAAQQMARPVQSPVGRVTWTGAVEDDEFDAWLAAATIAVQLRPVSNGESSGAVAEALARGIPTIVSDIGSLSELPDDVVVKVPADITAPTLAAVMSQLLGECDRRTDLHRAARSFAASETYSVGARRMMAAITADASRNQPTG